MRYGSWCSVLCGHAWCQRWSRALEVEQDTAHVEIEEVAVVKESEGGNVEAHEGIGVGSHRALAGERLLVGGLKGSGVIGVGHQISGLFYSSVFCNWFWFRFGRLVQDFWLETAELSQFSGSSGQCRLVSGSGSDSGQCRLVSGSGSDSGLVSLSSLVRTMKDTKKRKTQKEMLEEMPAYELEVGLVKTTKASNLTKEQLEASSTTIFIGKFKAKEGHKMELQLRPKEMYEVATDSELRELNSRLGLRRYYEQEPCRVDFQRAYELMSSIKEDGHARITDPQGEKVEVVVIKEIVAEALKLPTEGIIMRARDRKVEGVFKKVTAVATFNDINMKQVLKSTARPSIYHAQYVLNALKGTKKEAKVTYLGAPEVLTRIAYHAIGMANNLAPALELNTWDLAHRVSPRTTRSTKRRAAIIEESESKEEEQSAKSRPIPADSQESSDNAEKRARRKR
ncbi:hypothetical protein L7F22_000154 [Adiantum nelumboides]|nr:hypothetical protein [Adiantum nelumboides]